MAFLISSIDHISPFSFDGDVLSYDSGKEENVLDVWTPKRDWLRHSSYLYMKITADSLVSGRILAIWAIHLHDSVI